MDFKDTPEEAKFRAEVRSFLDANAKPLNGAVARRATSQEKERELEEAKAWQAKKAGVGLACIRWPQEYGGRGATAIEEVIFRQEEAQFKVPRGYFEIGLGMCGPTMMAYATEEQKLRYLPKMARGEEIWCQLFSEPAAGSDLAGLRTRADQVGEEWIINGQKVWTSGAQFCDFGIIVTRHDPTVPKHKGMTYFFLDMRSEGIDIKPIMQISGESNFNEVFFENVHVPDAQRLGDIGHGWRVALTTLMNERLAVGGAPPPDATDLIALARGIELEDGPAIDDPSVRESLADWYVQMSGLKFTHYRTMTALSKGETPGPEASIGKVVSAPKLQDIGSFGMDLQDMGGIMRDAAISPSEAIYQEAFLSAPGFRIAGGTDEILRNIIGERVLGLPGDIRVDKEKPFNELPTGSA